MLDLTGADPAAWTATEVPLVEADGDPLPAMVAAGLDTPEDPEPEYVDINDDDELVLTLQENNGVLVVDLPTAAIETVFSAGNARVSNIDTTERRPFNPFDAIDQPREPDAVQWVGDGLVATANEGDWKGGTRGWTVFDVATGEPVWDAGNTFENLATRHGVFNDDRADNKGAEPEGLAFAEVDGVPTAFVGAERSQLRRRLRHERPDRARVPPGPPDDQRPRGAAADPRARPVRRVVGGGRQRRVRCAPRWGCTSSATSRRRGRTSSPGRRPVPARRSAGVRSARCRACPASRPSCTPPATPPTAPAASTPWT